MNGLALACPRNLVVAIALASAAPHSLAQRTHQATRPSLTCSLRSSDEQPLDVRAGDELRFTVTARDADSGRISIVLLDTPPGLVFDPVVDEPSPATVEVTWSVGYGYEGRHDLVFQARGSTLETSRLVLPVRVLHFPGYEPTGAGVLTGDVTGDGVLDVVARARLEDDGLPPFDTGAIYVWAGAPVLTGAPTARLAVPGGATEFGALESPQLVDVTGDGIRDVVVLANPQAGACVRGRACSSRT